MNRKGFLKRLAGGVAAVGIGSKLHIPEEEIRSDGYPSTDTTSRKSGDLRATFEAVAHNSIETGDLVVFTTGGRVATYFPKSVPPSGIALNSAKRGDKVLMTLVS